ncbi:hypothetical protein EJB05_20185, partial [Eragrostis curvula]
MGSAAALRPPPVLRHPPPLLRCWDGEPDAEVLAEEARRRMRLAIVEALRRRLGDGEVIPYADLLCACEDSGAARMRAEAAALAGALDEAGVVLLFRDKVCLQSDKEMQRPSLWDWSQLGADTGGASSARGAGRGSDAFYRCHARDGRRGGRDFFRCRHRITGERGVECPLCHSLAAIFSNGKYKAVLHRTTVNKDKTRMSWPVFVEPPRELVVGPQSQLVTDENPAKYKAKKYKDYQYCKINKLPM